MFVISRKSKFDKVDNELFHIVVISREISSPDSGATLVPGLCPPAKLASKVGSMGKKKFAKKYIEYLKSDLAQIEIYNIVLAAKSNKLGFLFVCSDEEWKMGYLQILGNYLNDEFGYSVFDIKDAAKIIKEQYSSLSKKEKKNEKKFKKFTKEMLKGFKKKYMTPSNSGDSKIGKMRKRFALDYVLYSAIQEKYIMYNGTDAVPANEDVLKKFKISTLTTALEAASSADKKYKKIIKNVLSSHDLKLNKKSFKDLSKADALMVLIEATNLVHASRYENEEDE